LIWCQRRIPARANVEPTSPKVDRRKIKPEGLPQDMGARHDEYLKDFSEIFGL